jgi:hypothetical protein
MLCSTLGRQTAALGEIADDLVRDPALQPNTTVVYESAVDQRGKQNDSNDDIDSVDIHGACSRSWGLMTSHRV